MMGLKKKKKEQDPLLSLSLSPLLSSVIFHGGRSRRALASVCVDQSKKEK